MQSAMMTRNPHTDPTEDDTLAHGVRAGIAKHGGPMELKRFLTSVAAGHPAGTTHCGYQAHRHNTDRLKKSGKIVQVGVTRFGGYPTYDVAADEAA